MQMVPGFGSEIGLHGTGAIRRIRRLDRIDGFPADLPAEVFIQETAEQGGPVFRGSLDAAPIGGRAAF